MTLRSEFENPPIGNPDLSAAALRQILEIQQVMLRRTLMGDDADQLLDELCLLAESFTPNAIASVMLYDESRNGLFVKAGPSLNEAAINAFNGLRVGVGSCGNTVFHDEPMYVCNTLTDPRWANLVDVARELNICSCFSFPVRNAGQECIGSFAVSSFEHREPTGFHQALLDTCASICSVILQRKVDEELRQRVLEEQLKAKRIESLGVLAGGIAHDFNNLLTAIMGSVDLAESSLPPSSAKDDLQLAMKAIDRATELTSQLQTVAKGGAPLFAPSEIESIIRESAEFVLHGSNVSLSFTGVPIEQPPILNVDAGQIGQLVQNLVLNARQAMPDGGTISIRCEAIDQADHTSLHEGAYLKTTVIDSGTGIPASVLEQVFDPYVSTRVEGHGLGLFLCYLIAQKHGGRITIESEENAGTQVTFYLPWQQSLEIRESPTGTNRSFNRSGRILIMDDEELVRMTLERILTSHGFEVVVSNGGKQALARFLEDESITAVILDLTIPGGMGGIETKDRIRAINPNAKIIVSSGYSAGESCIDHVAAGFDGSISKPYTVAEVSSVLQQVLAPGTAAPHFPN